MFGLVINYKGLTMYRILRLLFIGTWELPKKHEPCVHGWEIIQSTTVDSPSFVGVGHIVKTLQCNKCGELKDHIIK